MLCACMLPTLRAFEAFLDNERKARDSAFHCSCDADATTIPTLF